MTTAITTSVYDELKELCEPFIEAYLDDLVKYDKQAIEERPGRSFLHWTRANGTWMAWLWDTDMLPAKGVKIPYLFGQADRERVSRGTVEIAEACQSNKNREGDSYEKLVLHYDGKRLRKIDCDQAVEIAKANHRRLLREWST